MKKTSKILSILLCITLFSTLLVGCGGSMGAFNSNQDQGKIEDSANLNEDTNGEENEDNKENPELEVEQPTVAKFVSPYNIQYPDAVRGIYVTSHSAGGARFEKLLDLVTTTDLNAMVIDIKDDHGYITYPLEDGHPYKDLSRRNIKDVPAMMKVLEQHQIYPIARIVVFKDSVMAQIKPEWSFKENGQVWKNRRGESFINPFLQEVWDYNVEIAKMAAELGFKEIQFDYVRFPEGFENRDDSLQYAFGAYKDRKPTKLIELEETYQVEIASYQKNHSELLQLKESLQGNINRLDAEIAQAASQAPAQGTNTPTAKDPRKAMLEKEMLDLNKRITDLEKRKPKEPNFTAKDMNVHARVDAVTDFVAYAKEQLKDYDVQVSVDIFGYTATLPEAPGIGQNFSKISSNVDVICSMIYPSHWTNNYFGIPRPDIEPYRLVKEYIKMENAKLAELPKPPVSRPWIQDFTASWLGSGNYKVYGKKEVEDQIRALNEDGVWEFLLWNAGNNYTQGVNYVPIGKKPQ
ncbi:putative glycoside hydrolase [Desulfuribacillus stibiiarsenatis]|uniref:putative glycoside hydrolase n=1 Tax=Desulfuribacillus stibiiarsenatis TaxID=1390249 RepID=UPI0009F5A8CD|nr:putative glycoside hydrolase [Desulfuribacillus stibiiarsenatis]